MNGILIVDKPMGVTSADVVRSVKRSARVKVGHLGTLDPFASGLLPLCLGEATKVAQFLNAVDKTYEGIIQLGQATDTGDCTGTVTATGVLPKPDPPTLNAVAQRFLGASQQIPPMYSAVKQNGMPLYKLARQGIEVERASREICIDALVLEPMENGQLFFQVSCSKGTYVRVLGEDIGRALGTVAHLHTLRRTRFGRFEQSQAVDLREWGPGAPGLLSIRESLSHLPCVDLDADGVTAARRGQGWWLAKAMANREGPEVVLIDPNGEVVAVVEKQGNHWQFARVLVPAQTLQGGAPMVGPHSKQDG